MFFTPENINYAFKNLLARKSRSLLTILSIFVGITTIFIFISFGLGLVNYVNDLAEEAGVDKVLIQAKGVGSPGTDTTFALTDDDLDVIDRSSGVDEATGIYYKPVSLESSNELRFTGAMGVDPDHLELMEQTFTLDLLKGRQLRSGDTSKVVMGYSYTQPQKVFTRPLEVGDRITIQDTRFRIVGFYDSLGNPEDDKSVYITADQMERVFSGNVTYAFIMARVHDVDEMDATIEGIKKDLRKERGLDEGKEDFFVQSFEELIEQFSSALNIIIGFVVLVALISVVVSAVNTANTMVASVLERIPEIGVMKSIGATNGRIRNIFLLEATLLGTVAGIIGVALGWAISDIGGRILESLGYGFLQPSYSPMLFIGCIVFAALVGTISSVVPAVRASRQNPVDALRYE